MGAGVLLGLVGCWAGKLRIGRQDTSPQPLPTAQARRNRPELLNNYTKFGHDLSFGTYTQAEGPIQLPSQVGTGKRFCNYDQNLMISYIELVILLTKNG